MEDTNNFGKENLEVGYDNHNILYVPVPFDYTPQRVSKYQLRDDLQKLLNDNNEIYFKIVPTKKMEYIDLCDLSQYQSGKSLFEEDKTVRQVLEIITSQHAIDSGNYEQIGSGMLYHFEEIQISGGLCARKGILKGVRMIEIGDDKTKKVAPALVIDYKFSPFYAVGNLRKKVNEFVKSIKKSPWQEASKFFQGCKVCPIYDPRLVLTIKDFDKLKLNKISFKLGSSEKTFGLVDYYRTTKNQKIQHPKTFAVNLVDGNGKNKGQFPLELLTILPNQKIYLGDKVPKFTAKAFHKKSAVPAQERYNTIMKEVKNMHFNNKITQAFGIHVSTEPIEKASVLQFERPPKPKILVGKDLQGNYVEIQPKSNGNLIIGDNKYFHPSTIQNMGFIYGTHCQKQTIEKFQKNFKNAAENRGIIFETKENFVQSFDTRSATYEKWEKLFTAFQNEGISFIVFIDSKSINHSHGMLKMMELFKKIVTQHITYEIVMEVIEKNKTDKLQNILLKTNIKNGGINYKPLFDKKSKLDLNTGDVMIMAYDVAHSSGFKPKEHAKAGKKGNKNEKDNLSVVGVASNVDKDSTTFSGKFLFQPYQEEVVGLRDITKEMLIKFQNNKEKLPNIIVITRDGLSESQFKMAFEKEFKDIKEGVAEVDQNYKPEYVFTICTKRHHKRFFEDENENFQNPQAGSFVVDKFTRPDCMEFFMQCHNAIKGTAKFLQVSAINEHRFTKKELINFLHSTCYNHQIIRASVSLPAPVFQAHELAKRGMEVYQTLKQHKPELIKCNENSEIDYNELNALLSYSGSELGNRRFYA